MAINTKFRGIKNAIAENKEARTKKSAADKTKYPDPAFFRAKDNIDWKAQGRNLKEVIGICKEMFKEADHKAFWKLQAERCKDDLARCVLELRQAT
jgi:hypothetical protein